MFDGVLTMTNEQMLSIVEEYVKQLERYDAWSEALSDTSVRPSFPGDGRPVENHLYWMCEQVPVFLQQGEVDKANRWLGFIQGSLWIMGYRTIDQMRNDCRQKP